MGNIRAANCLPPEKKCPLWLTKHRRNGNPSGEISNDIYCFCPGPSATVSYTHLDVYKRQGLSHVARALIGIALCNRWGGNIPEQEEKYMQALEQVVLREGKSDSNRIVWWTKYIGTIMYVICGVHPGGNIRDDVFDFSVSKKSLKHEFRDLTIDEALASPSSHSKPNQSEHSTKHVREFEVVVRISKDDLKTSASVRSRIITLQKKIRKLSRGSSEKVRIGVQFHD